MAIDSCLVDTNILLRLTRRNDPQHNKVDTALAVLAGVGTTLFYTLQNIAELWNVLIITTGYSVWQLKKDLPKRYGVGKLVLVGLGGGRLLFRQPPNPLPKF